MKLKGLSNDSIKRIAKKVRAETPDEGALMTALQDWISKTNMDIMQEAMGEGDSFYQKYGEPLGEVTIWTPEESLKFSNYPSDKGAVTLVYEGAGYDYLSPYADFPSVGAKYRGQIEDIAKKYGFYAEDNNSWSMSFWPEL